MSPLWAKGPPFAGQVGRHELHQAQGQTAVGDGTRRPSGPLELLRRWAAPPLSRTPARRS